MIEYREILYKDYWLEFTITSLFSGCGGLDLGFCGGFDFLNRHYAKNPFKIIYANDLDKNAVLTYQRNFNAHMNAKMLRKLILIN